MATQARRMRFHDRPIRKTRDDEMEPGWELGLTTDRRAGAKPHALRLKELAGKLAKLWERKS